MKSLRWFPLLLLAVLTLLPSCATNPATGQTELNLVSEAMELQMGAEAHGQVLAEFPVYDEKPELNAMVDRIGKRVAASSPRPQLAWTFTLLDTPMVNAMALPGGYIYVTRGILERMSSEDELAGVIGHEVAHVAARHAAQRISRATLASVGLVAAAAMAGEERTERYGPFVMLGAGLLFTKYNRSQETQADLLGTRYMARSGWNPTGSADMLRVLQRLQGGAGSGIERYFMDHPDPAKRVGDVRHEIEALRAADPRILDRPVSRDAFVRRLDGLVTGNSTASTVLRGGVVYHRPTGMVAQVPQGWKAALAPGSIFAMARGESEALFAQAIAAGDLKKHDSPRAAVRSSFESAGLSYTGSESVTTASGDRLAIDAWAKAAEGGTLHVRSTTLRAADGAVALIHLAPAAGSPSLRRFAEALELGSERARRIQPPRLRIATARAGDTWEKLAERATGRREDAKALAHINGFDHPSEVPAGALVKLPEEIAD